MNDNRSNEVTFININLIIEPKLNCYLGGQKRLNIKLSTTNSEKVFLSYNKNNIEVNKSNSEE
ncbi:hypothetical protein [Clostridium botulinum]|uniref:Uncharacterized protein n=2 Tax=Clostridium botulinum TaxID=1491 RepID=A0A9Q1V050_CLOBO|nr:hypothetical protein [Clostridium botulinum]KEI01875.1 hypothetical protein Z953_08355 [Clostridium botulinum D str. 16868]KLU75052.1 hypothetical protein CBC3_11360 [Clostridium botulinum V891]AEB75130.1 putative hypothetical protein [Clostridium botulinum BKT015925]KEI05614.1 hypothetical protein Y848_05620 [Clostridium botulinum C/D str. Sp77]KOA77199.1 hypothetical protein ADU78_04330 [Clostridium botulinum]